MPSSGFLGVRAGQGLQAVKGHPGPAGPPRPDCRFSSSWPQQGVGPVPAAGTRHAWLGGGLHSVAASGQRRRLRLLCRPEAPSTIACPPQAASAGRPGAGCPRTSPAHTSWWPHMPTTRNAGFGRMPRRLRPLQTGLLRAAHFSAHTRCWMPTTVLAPAGPSPWATGWVGTPATGERAWTQTDTALPGATDSHTALRARRRGQERLQVLSPSRKSPGSPKPPAPGAVPTADGHTRVPARLTHMPWTQRPRCSQLKLLDRGRAGRPPGQP